MQGIVSVKADDLPIEGVKVAVLDELGVPMEGKDALTLANGSYKIIGLKNGKYALQVDAAGYEKVDVPFVVNLLWV